MQTGTSRSRSQGMVSTSARSVHSLPFLVSSASIIVSIIPITPRCPRHHYLRPSCRTLGPATDVIPHMQESTHESPEHFVALIRWSSRYRLMQITFYIQYKPIGISVRFENLRESDPSRMRLWTVNIGSVFKFLTNRSISQPIFQSGDPKPYRRVNIGSVIARVSFLTARMPTLISLSWDH